MLPLALLNSENCTLRNFSIDFSNPHISQVRIVKNDVEKPNDISGVVYISYDESGAWKIEIAKELKAAGYNIDFNKLF